MDRTGFEDAPSGSLRKGWGGRWQAQLMEIDGNSRIQYGNSLRLSSRGSGFGG